MTTLSGTALELSDTTDGKGEVSFQLPVGSYLFRADYQGHQYFSPETPVFAFQESQAAIDVGGGSFVLTLQTDSGDPLAKVETSVYTEDGLSLAESARTDKRGQVSYDLAAGEYKIRIDYMGHDFWTDLITVPEMTELVYVIEHKEVTVAATRDYLGDQLPLKNVKVQLWTADGRYIKVFEKIGKDYLAHFSLPEREYVFKVEYLDLLFPSDPLVWTDTEVIINEGMAEVTLADNGVPLAGVPVSVFSINGTDLGLTANTSADGQVLFRLPESTYTFRAEYNTELYQATASIPAHQLTPIALDISGGTISLTLKSSASTVMVGIPCTLYDTVGNSLERTAITDSQGMVSFDVPAGDYVIMASYLGAEYPSEVYTVPGVLAATLLIEHQQVAVTVSGADGLTEEVLAGLRCSLFTEAGVDTGVIATTDANGVAIFNVPFNLYRVAVDYLGQQYWTEPFDWYDTSLVIPLGSLSLHVTDLGADVPDAAVYLFSDGGDYLGLNSLTDSSGATVLQVPEGAYRLRVDYDGGEYWSDVVHVLAYQDNPVNLALDLLVSELSNDPHPKRFDGKAPEYRPMLATVGTLAGLLAVTDSSQLVVNNEPKTYYYISDHLNTAQLLVDEFGVVVWQGNYSPFGAVDVVAPARTGSDQGN